jgi:Fe-Mn family superoxide dismutase
MSLEEVMLKTWNGGKPTPEFNNAAQVINHTVRRLIKLSEA